MIGKKAREDQSEMKDQVNHEELRFVIEQIESQISKMADRIITLEAEVKHLQDTQADPIERMVMKCR